MPPVVTVKRLSDHSFVEASLADVGRLAGEPGVVWVDVLDPDEATMAGLAEQLDLPDLAVEDSLQVETRAKLDSYPDLLYFAWIVPIPADPDTPLRSLEFCDVSFFMTKSAVVTTRPGPVKAIDDLLRGRVLVSSAQPSWLVHAILDRTTDELLDTVDAGSDKLDDLENAVVEKADQSQIEALYVIKRQLLSLRRIVQGERDVMRELARQEAWVGRDAYMYYEDVSDHLARIADEVDTYLDMATGIMDIYLSAQNNRMNEIMKQLTAVATIFMPLTLISGIYGMNLLTGMWPRPVEDAWGFAVVVGSMVIIAVTMAVYFRTKKWW
jgi:magnesium transporter